MQIANSLVKFSISKEIKYALHSVHRRRRGQDQRLLNNFVVRTLFIVYDALQSQRHSYSQEYRQVTRHELKD